MAPKSPQKKDTNGGPGGDAESFSLHAPAEGGMERMMAEFARMLEAQEFESLEEADRFMDRILHGNELPPLEPADDSPRGRAQDLIYDAWEFQGAFPRVELAREALELWPDCADAYCILAESAAHTLKEARAIYEQAVEAGARAIGEPAFAEWAGSFWSVLETRPYMRARAGLSEVLWSLGECDAAISHLHELLKLCPNDNMGLRYIQVNRLLALGRDEEAGELLDQYKGDVSATWAYSRALLVFRQKGAGRSANARLRAAQKVNEYVPDLMLGYVEMPEALPPYVGIGDDTEAASYVADSLRVWMATEGALEWMEDLLLP